MNKKINCNIILDLLPLYHDDVVSEETKTAISEHINTCESCKKEFQLISAELPTVSSSTTKDKFLQMVKKQKFKRISNIFISALLGCATTAFGIYVLTTEPLKTLPSDKVEILQTFVAETEQGREVFLWVSTSHIGATATTGQIDVKEKSQYNITQKVPVISMGQEKSQINEFVYSFPIENQGGEVEEIYFNNSLIWSQSENAYEEIPPYVYEYLNRDYDSRSIELNYTQGFFGFGYEDTYMTYWDLDGNIINGENVDID